MRTEIRSLPMSRVTADPDQPRKIFRDAELADLAAAIDRHGLIQPIKVRETRDGEGYIIIAGERRYRAHKLLGKTTIRAMVVKAKKISAEDVAEQAIIENLHRADLTPLEEARAFNARIVATGCTPAELAERLGIKNVKRITDRLSLLQLMPEMQEALTRGDLFYIQAVEMARLAPEYQRVFWNAVVDGRCTNPAQMKATAAALLARQNQAEMFAEAPAAAEARARDSELVTQLEKRIDAAVALLRDGFDENEVVILGKVNRLHNGVLADKLELIERELKKLRLALRADEVAAVDGTVAA